MCGGTHAATGSLAAGTGLSPRVRGNPNLIGGIFCEDGTIPACAGEPIEKEAKREQPRDYPRVCGGTLQHVVPHLVAQGLSPRVRGNPLAQPEMALGAGTIPACAGEPS